MKGELFNLNWDTYTDHLRGLFHDIWNSNELADVTLVCEDKRQFKAHKVILSASSKVFRSFICDNNTALCIKGVNLRKKSEICGRSLYLCGLNVLFAAYHRHKLWWRFQTPSLSKKLSYWRFKISSNSKIFGHLCTLG